MTYKPLCNHPMTLEEALDQWKYDESVQAPDNGLSQLIDVLRQNEILRKALIAANGRVTPEMQKEYQNSAPSFKIQEYLDHANKIINEMPYQKVNFPVPDDMWKDGCGETEAMRGKP